MRIDGTSEVRATRWRRPSRAGQKTQAHTTGALGSGALPVPTKRVEVPSARLGDDPSCSRPPQSSSPSPRSSWGRLTISRVVGGREPREEPAREQIDTPRSPPPRPETPAGMVLIPAGTFEMGRTSADLAEGPPHQVSVSAYFLDKTEVTNEQYAAFAQRLTSPRRTGGTSITCPGRAISPSTNVSWLTRAPTPSGRTSGLPTEAEWEYAARGTTGGCSRGERAATRRRATKETGIKKPQPVGSMPGGVSPFGVFDMIGNVWEWCEDGFRLYPNSTFQVKPTEQMHKIVRGGSFESDQDEINAFTRYWFDPEKPNPLIGFRCAKSVE